MKEYQIVGNIVDKTIDEIQKSVGCETKDEAFRCLWAAINARITTKL